MTAIRKYQTPNGKTPLDDWLNKLRDHRAKAQVLTRIRRLSIGLEGDWKSVGEGVRELRIREGKGYRVYYAWEGEALILLLCGGDKSTQTKDIETAKRYWQQYRNENHAQH